MIEDLYQPETRTERRDWTEEERAAGRKAGREAVADKAAHVRALWREEVIRMIVDGFTYSRISPSRDKLIEGLRAYNLTHRIKGKCGMQIKRSTISRWLTEERESELRVEAIEILLAAERLRCQK